ncbi:hypothetical protein, partial [Clostridium sp.]|uniref:hypothetical protein n=1 Tax=Clostridium sp. TaxID=1506 RepID=UPI0026335226
MKKLFKVILIIIIGGILLVKLNEYNKIKDLTLENFEYQYEDSGSYKEKAFTKDYKYNRITKLANNFVKDLVNEDYTKEHTYFDYIDYYSIDLKDEITESDKEQASSMIRENKSKVEYIKSNLD